VVTVEISNRSGTDVEEEAAADLARRVLAAEGIEEGDLGLVFVGPDEMRRLKHEHLGVDEATDVLSFPIDRGGSAPAG
jgi:ssRNA-specific RNase YbeY (16S rRNA maturation enzyme)